MEKTKIKTNISQEKIRLFYGADKRNNYTLFQGDYAHATDFHSCLRWKEEGLKNTSLDLETLFTEFSLGAFNFVQNEYLEWQKGLPLVNEKKECGTCFGDGECEWECGIYVKILECPQCGGLGETVTGRKGPSKQKHFNLSGLTLSQNVADKIKLLLDEYGLPAIQILKDANNRGYLSIGDYEFIFMFMEPFFNDKNNNGEGVN